MNFGQILDKVDFFYPVQLHHCRSVVLEIIFGRYETEGDTECFACCSNTKRVNHWHVVDVDSVRSVDENNVRI